jgi:uncharacterized repeat protein (TIGR03803 family)
MENKIKTNIIGSLRLIAAVSVLAAAAAPFGVTASPLTVVYTFTDANSSLGKSPNGGLVWGGDGNFYGTTELGGPNSGGTIFSMTPVGSLVSLASFGTTDPIGSMPYTGVTFYGPSTPGTLFGTCYAGGPSGAGSVFQYNPDRGISSTPFTGGGASGGHPEGALIVGNDGLLYGTSSSGTAKGAGAVWQGLLVVNAAGLTLPSAWKAIHTFDGSDGSHPAGALVQGRDGRLYGTTRYGDTNHNFGTVFSLSLNGTNWVFDTLWQFTGGADGGFPNGGLVQGTDGNFYGTTHYGGTNVSPAVAGGGGTIFKISPSKMFTLLHSFGDTYPNGPLIQGTDGNFYGVTGGGLGNGSVFQISSTGDFNPLVQFDGTDGRNPYGSLIQFNDSHTSGYGYLYGTTAQGGSDLDGTIFSLSLPSLAVSTQLISGLQAGSTGAQMQMLSAAGITYQLQYVSSPNDSNWINVGSPVPGTGVGAVTLSDPGAPVGGMRFYRVVIATQ